MVLPEPAEDDNNQQLEGEHKVEQPWGNGGQQEASRPPPIPSKKALVAKAQVLMRKVLTPMAIAASSSSRIAFIIRPYFDHTSWRIMPVASRANSPHQNRDAAAAEYRSARWRRW